MHTRLIVCEHLGRISSPRVEDRREGFAWDTHQVDEPRHANDRPPRTPQTPPTLEELSRSYPKADNGECSLLKDLTAESLSRTSTKELSASSRHHAPSRTDSNRSSISDVARGMRRHILDPRLFRARDKKSTVEIKPPKAPDDSVRASPAVRQPPVSTSKATSSSKKSSSTLKDRRKLPRKEAMNLTLPLELPTIPPRSRVPFAESYSLVPSRPRSPKTPWIEDKPPEWYHQDPKKAPAPIAEAEEPSGPAKDTSDGLLQTHPVDSSTAKASRKYTHRPFRWGISKRTSDPNREEHKDPRVSRNRPLPHVNVPSLEQGIRSRSRRFRYTSSNDLSTTPQSERSQSSFTFSRLFRPKRADEQLLTPPIGRRNKTLEALDKMSLPPSFVPPGLSRVPTPPMFDASGEVKGKLADFYFDLHGVHRHKTPASPGGIWDSDVLLMSQHTDLERDSRTLDELPQDPMSDSPVDIPNQPLFPFITTPTGGMYTPVTPPHYLSDVQWATAGANPTDTMDAATCGAEEIAKLEWLIPEHLPTSPLCPLHAKYSGPSMDLCVFHSKKRHLSEARTKAQISQTTGTESGKKEQSRNTVARSRREGSALDGSEDADETRGSSGMTVWQRPRTKRRWFSVL